MHARLSAGSARSGAMIAGAKDVLFRWLTGRLLTDPSTAAGSGVFDIEKGCWDGKLAAAAGDLRAAGGRARRARRCRCVPEWRDRWDLPGDLPVVLGAADSVLGVLGVGRRAPR